MKSKKKKYSLFQLISAVLMILALLWLTVSAPFVQASQQALAEHVATSSSDIAIPISDSDDENSNPFGNNTEEKAPTSSSSFSEEYLHDSHKSDYLFSIISRYHKCENAATYVAFHGELLVPPPNIA